MPNENGIAVSEERTLVQAFDGMADKFLERGFNDEQLKQVRALLEHAVAANTDGELKERLDATVRSVEQMREEIKAGRYAYANGRFAQSDSRVRVRTSSGSGLDGLPVEQAEAERIVLRAVQTQTSWGGGVGWIGQRAAALDAALNETPIDRDGIEAHFDAMDKRLKDAGRGGNGKRGGGLDNVLKFARDAALGRVPGQMEWDGRALSGDGSVSPGTAPAGTGADWIPTLLGTTFWPDILMSSDLINRLPNMAMTGKTQEVPLWGADILETIFRTQGELDAQLQRSPETHVVRLDAKDLNGYQRISNNIMDDSAPPIMQGFMEGFTEAVELAIEDALINADTNSAAANNVNGYAYATAPSGSYTDANYNSNLNPKNIGFDGLRAKVNALSGQQVDQGGSANITHANILALRSVLGMAGIDPNRFFYLMGATEYYAAQTIEEFARYDAFGALNALATGTLPFMSRTPVVVSEAFPLGFLGSGRVHASTGNTTGAMMAIVPQLCLVGVRKMPQFRTAPAVGPQLGMAVDVAVHMRLAFNIRNELRPGRAALGLLRNIHR